MRDKEYLEKRKAAIIGNIVDSLESDKLKTGWNIMQKANAEELAVLKKSTRDNVGQKILETKFGPEFAHIATNIMKKKDGGEGGG